MGNSSDFSALMRVLLSFTTLILLLRKAHSWGKEGHILTCQIAQSFLGAEATEAVQSLLPDYAGGNLSALCAWPDEIRHVHGYAWTASLHFIDTPDGACNFRYSRDCHGQDGVQDECVAGAIKNFTSQLSPSGQASDGRYNMTEALLFLSHFMGDVHQPLHVGFTTDKGGNTIGVKWFKQHSSLHHVWDSGIILTEAAELFDHDVHSLMSAIQKNVVEGPWSNDVPSWKKCDHLGSCVDTYAEESAELACRWAYQGVREGSVLEDEYLNSRSPVVMKRIAQGGVRLSVFLNQIFKSVKR